MVAIVHQAYPYKQTLYCSWAQCWLKGEYFSASGLVQCRWLSLGIFKAKAQVANAWAKGQFSLADLLYHRWWYNAFNHCVTHCSLLKAVLSSALNPSPSIAMTACPASLPCCNPRSHAARWGAAVLGKLSSADNCWLPLLPAGWTGWGERIQSISPAFCS